jgi:hypothetical protein
MTTEEIKRMVDDGRAEQLTAQLCRHWEVAAERLGGLVQELSAGMDTCVEAEIYAAMMRMQGSVTALVELNKMPTAYLFSEYLDRIGRTVSDTSIRQSVMALTERMMGEKQSKQKGSFFDIIIKALAQHAVLPAEKQEDILQKASPMQHVLSVCAQHLKPEDLMMVMSVIQNMNSVSDNQEDAVRQITDMRQAMDELNNKMSESLQMMLIWLVVLTLLPGMMVSMMQQSRTNSKAMARLFNKVLLRVRESTEWWNYWRDRRETLRVVSDSSSWKDIMTAERTKEREALGQVRGGLFAKWTTDRDAFDAEFLEVGLSDDDLRCFIFHLAALSEIARELEPTTKFGEEQLVLNDEQRVGEAVMAAAQKLHDLVAAAWFPHYDAMWQELIANEEIFDRLKVTRKSPHNNLFTARFFCHLVGEMKKSAVFGAHSDGDLAEKLTSKRYVGTFRKNIQEGMGAETETIRNVFNAIYLKYNALARHK